MSGERAQFCRFVATSTVSAIANATARYVFNFYLPFEVAVVLAFPVGLVTAFVLARRFVFRKSERAWMSELYRFFLVNILGVVVVWFVSVALYRGVFPLVGFEWQADTVAHVVGLGSTALTSYFGHRHYTFRRRST
jgi:putative flippase GtrA